jgi:Ca2+-binding RTX toxin-like protein
MTKFTRVDLDFILTQIKMAETGQPPVNPLLSFGLRTVDGTNNNIVSGQGTFGSVDQPFPTVTDPLLQNAQSGTSYSQTSGLVIDAQPRLISDLIADQSAKNPAAVAAQAQALSFLGAGYQNTTLPGTDGIYGTADDIVSGNLATPTNASSSGSTIPGLAQSLFINNVTPDNGLSAPFSSWFTFFGQFFDHGLDLITKGGDGTVFIPLAPDDPLYVAGSPTNFMVLTRATNLPGPDGIVGTADDIHQSTNTITPFVDQSQTYASDPSHQVFLREYMIGSDGKLHSTGALLGHDKADGSDGMATWADVKQSAAQFLGIKLTDADVGDVPLLATDAYGNLILGAHGLAQLVVKNADGTTRLVEGNLAAPISTANALHTGHAFINDMAHAASPVDDFGHPLVADTDNVINAANHPPAAGFYDNELLDAHYAAGDGRVNENIGLTAVQDIFHTEHDRLLAQTKALVQSELDKGDVSFASDWVLPGVNLTGPELMPDGTVRATHLIADNEWNGERLFQVAKFGTETEYQHLVFEEFARAVAPSIHVFSGVNVHLDPAITSEFANVVYRFGHSMLDENINLYQIGADGKSVMGANGQPLMTTEGLIQAFTNPLQFASDPNMTADIVLGSVNQVGNEIDEFVTGSLRNNLLGLPLDLAALNIARGRDTGVAPLNLVRAQIYSQTGDSQLKPYVNWEDFGNSLKHPASLINFVAAYGTHASITGAMTMAAKRAAAEALVNLGTPGLGFNPANPASLDAYNFMHSLGAYADNKLDARAIHDAAGLPAAWSTGSVTGLDAVDMWIGGLAEKQSLFGGVLGSTFEYIFRTQMESLQDGDRLYYLPRVEGTDFEESLQNNSFAQMIRDDTGIKHLPGNIFLTPEYTIEASDYFVKNPDGSFARDGAGNKIAVDSSKWLHNPQTGQLLVNVTADGTVQFIGDNNFLGNTIVLGGTEGNDKLTAGAADDDTIWGDGGNDTIDGGGGNDFLYGGDGNDLIFGGQGDDTIHGDAGNDTIFGGDGLDTIFGSDGNDYIDGGRGDDVIMGGLGNDIIIGGEGANELTGGAGDDWLESAGGQGDLMFGDSGAPTGQQPLYSGNDVMIGGAAGGDVMKGFSGDDIMLGRGSFTKFIGGLGFDWASYEQAVHGVDVDMTRKEFVAANGTENAIRDVFQQTEGVSGSAFDDILMGTNDTKLLTTKNELDNANLIIGLPSFFDPGQVLFDGGNIMLGGSGNDTIIGGGGNDVIDGDAWLHVALTKQAAGGEIIRQILYDPAGNTWDPDAQAGNVSAANVDTAVFNDIMANYNIALFGQDAEGFLTIQHNIAAAGGGGGGGGGVVVAVDDGTDRIRHIERLQFSDVTVAIDADGRLLDPHVSDPHYDAVPIGTPTITAADGTVVDPTTTVTVGNRLTASVTSITDADGISTPFSLQWQVLDILSAKWIDIVGANSATFTPTAFQDGQSIRVKATYIDGKTYKETVSSTGTALITLPGNINTPPFLVAQQQFNGISNTSAQVNAPFDFFTPLTKIFNDNQTAPAALVYTATLGDGSSLASIGLSFTFDPVTGSGEFKTLPGSVLDTPGQIPIRVTATDNGPGVPLSVTNTFIINVLPPNLPPVAVNDSYTTLENLGLTVLAPTSVLRNDSDPNGEAFTAAVVTGPAHGTLAFNPNGTFVYIPNQDYTGVDSFTYRDTDTGLATSNVATATINVAPVGTVAIVPTAPATTTSISARFAFGGPVQPAVYSWESSLDGTTWAGVAGATGQTYQPAVTDAPGIFLRATATFIDATTSTSTKVTSAPLHYILDGSAGGVTGHALTGIAGNNIIFAAPGDDVISAGTGPMLAYGGDGNDRFVASVGDGNATYDGQAGINTYDLSLTSAAATVNLAAGTATSAQTGSDTLVSIQSLIGSSGNDVLTGNDLGNTLTGGAGNDTLTGGAGDDTFSATVGDGNDSDNGGGGINTYDLSRTTTGATVNLLLGTATSAQTGSDTLVSIQNVIGSSGNDVITGNDSGNTLTGGAGNDTLTGGAGNDTFIATAGDGNDIYNSGGGFNTYDLSQTSAAATVDLLRAVANSAQTGVDKLFGIQNVIGSSGNDNITGNGTNSILAGGAGNDVLSDGVTPGNVGSATMTGGTGNEFYFVKSASDVIIENAGEGTDTVFTTLSSYTLGANLEALKFIGANNQPGTGSFTGTANDAGNVIVGGNGPNTLIGGAGADNLFGGTGNDVFTGGAGNDVMTGGGGNDTFNATAGDGNDIYIGGGAISTYDLSQTSAAATVDLLRAVASSAQTGVDRLVGIQNVIGSSGNDNIIGNGTNSVLAGGAGNDVLSDGVTPGNVGSATMIGGTGNEFYFVKSASDVISENAGEGSDTVFTTLNSYTLGANLETLKFIGPNNQPGTGSFTGTANDAGNLIVGGNGPNTLIGGKGADSLFGGTGNDVLTGGTGNDVMTGGGGNDTFQYLAAGFGKDILMDFASSGAGTDLIDISGFGITAGTFANSVTIANFGPTDTMVTVLGGGGAGGTIKLVNVAFGTVDATDFRLAA